MASVNFKFAIGDKVLVSNHGIDGVVCGLYCGRDGELQAWVEYTDSNSEVHSKYFSEVDLAGR